MHSDSGVQDWFLKGEAATVDVFQLREDFSYILDQFPIVRRNDEKQYGEYRTKRLCLEAWDR